MTPLGLAWRSLIRQPARALLGIAGIAAVGALLFDMLLLSEGLVLSFEDLLDRTGYDVRVTPTDSLPGMGPPFENVSGTVRSIGALDEVDEVVALCFGGAEVTASDGEIVGISLTGSGSSARGTWTMIEGENLPAEDRALTGPPPVVVNPALASRLGLSPGSPLVLRADPLSDAALPQVELRVSGIADFTFAAEGQLGAVTTLRAYHQVYGDPGRDTADLLLVASAEGTEQAVAAIRRSQPEIHAYSNRELVAGFRETDFSYFRQISFVLSSITLFFAFVLVATLLTVSVNQRYAEIAGLRAIGFPRRRVAADLLCESALFVGAGGGIALPLGLLIARWLDRILHGIPGIPEKIRFFVFQPEAVLLYLALLAATALLAALYPVLLAARLPIARTLRNEVIG